MYHASELQNQWWEAFCGEYIQQHQQMIPREDVNHTVPPQIGWVYEEVINCDTSSTETGSTLYASEDEISPQPSLEISRYILPERTNPEYSNKIVPWDYTSNNIVQTTNPEQCSFEIRFHKQQCLENDSWVLDLSMNNSSQTETTNTTNVQLLCDCKTVLNNSAYVNLKDNRDNECSQHNSFKYPCLSDKNESIPVYDLSTTSTSSNNGIIPLMKNEIENEMEIRYSLISDNEISHCSEVLDLSLPRSERIERVIKKPKLKLSQEIIIDDVVEVETENNLPEDLPDLSFSDIRMTVPQTKSRGKTEKWIYSVRRRLLKLSTIKKMFGLDEENINEITLLYGGRGLKNPIRSNIPPFANHLNHERKYMCVYCDREFKNPKVLSRHYTQHTSYRKCFCTVCWRGFYDSYDLKRHLEKHQEITVFYCELCESIYAQNITKETHYRNIHRHIYSIA